MLEVSERLFSENVGLAYWYIKKYFSQYFYDDDIKQEALFGLWKAAETFKAENEVKFSTYACKCMRNQILMEFRKRKKQTEIELIRLEDCISGNEDLKVCQMVEDSKSGIDASCIELMDYIGRLPKKKQKNIKLKLEGSNQKEIGQAVGVSQPNCSRILKKIKLEFETL